MSRRNFGGSRGPGGGRSHSSRTSGSSHLNRVSSMGRNRSSRTSSVVRTHSRIGLGHSHSRLTTHSHINHSHETMHRPRASVHEFGGLSYTTHSTNVYGTSSYTNFTSKKTSLLGVLIFFSVIFTIFLALAPFLFNPIKGIDVQDIKEDYIYYHNMIRTAQNTMNDQFVHNDKIVDGKIVSIYKHTYSDKYWFSYSYIDNFNKTRFQDSYSVFDKEDIGDLIFEGKNIQVAISGFDSMPVMLLNYDYEEDGDYIAIQSYKKDFAWLKYVWVLGVVLVVVLLIFQNKSIKQDKKNHEENMSKNKTQANKLNKCRYCGSVLSSDKTTCSSCGAAIDHTIN